MKKRCYKCNEEKNLSEFRKDKSRKDGHHVWCNICARAQSKNYNSKSVERTRNRMKTQTTLYNELKDTLSCVVCGEEDNCCIEFHHKDPSDKNFIVAASKMRSWENILKEIDKCVVVCSNCHKKIHAGKIKIGD